MTATTSITAPLTVYSVAQEAQAVQWTGSDESLRLIQDLIFPDSPLRGIDSPTQLGIMVPRADASKFLKTELRHIEAGSWIVKTADGLQLLTDAQFKQRFSSPELIEQTPLDLDKLAAASAEQLAASLRRTADLALDTQPPIDF